MELISHKLKRALANNPASTVYSRNIRWFLTTHVNQIEPNIENNYREVMEPGKIYTFLYDDPKYKDKLEFYDAYPMNLILGHIEVKGGTRNPFGINLSYLPPKVRVAVLDKFVETFEGEIDRNREIISRYDTLFGHSITEPLPISYQVAKYLLQGSGFEFAIRSYIYDRVNSYPTIVTYNDWWKLATFPSQFIRGLNVLSIYIQYKKKLNPAFRVGTKEKSIILKNVSRGDINSLL